VIDNMPGSDKKDILKYKGSLTVDQHAIGMKPFVLNVLCHLCEALVSELKDVTEQIAKGPGLIILSPPQKNNGSEERVKLQLGTKIIIINAWTQDMIASTLIGFLSTLKIELDKPYSDALIQIEYERKS
jgi:hypothetical protein